MTAPLVRLREKAAPEAAPEASEGRPGSRRSVALPQWFGGVVGAVVIVAVWTLFAMTTFKNSGAVPTPLAVLRQFHDDSPRFYLGAVSVSLRSALLGFLWGNALAIAVALLVMLIPSLDRVATQVAVISHCMPLTAIGPIVLVVFGGRAPSIVLAGTGVFFTTLVGSLLGLKSADRGSLDLVTAYGGGRWQRVTKVRAIAALPAMLSALKIAAPTALLGTIIGEYLGGVDSGIGVAITAAQQGYVVPRTWGLALACGFVAGLGYLVIGLIGRLVTPWAKAVTGVGGGLGSGRGRRSSTRLIAFGQDIWALIWPMLVAVALVLLGWIVLLKAFSVPKSIGKMPSDVWTYLFTSAQAPANRSLIADTLGTTLHDATLGYVGGLAAAIVIALLFVLSASIEQAFMPIATLLRSVPLVAITPIITLIFQRGSVGVAVMGAIVVFFPALVTIVFGLRSVPDQTSALVVAYGGSRLTVLRKVAVPNALPAFFAAARIAVPGSLIGALVAEWLSTGKGIGGVILNAIGAFAYNQVWTSIAVLTGVSLLIYTAVGVVESVVLNSAGFTGSP